MQTTPLYSNSLGAQCTDGFYSGKVPSMVRGALMSERADGEQGCNHYQLRFRGVSCRPTCQ